MIIASHSRDTDEELSNSPTASSEANGRWRPRLQRFAVLVLWASQLVHCDRSCGGSTSTQSAGSAPVHETDSYKLTVSSSGEYKVGNDGTVIVRLNSKGSYKVNIEYPFRFECLGDADHNLTYPKRTLTQDDGQLGEREAVFDVHFVPRVSGELTVGGVFSLSVCNDHHCIIDKRKLVVDVNAR